MTFRSPYSALGIAAILVLGGFVLLFLGWKGGAATLFVPSQVAFGVSGGMMGLALIGTGLAVATAHLTRVNTARRSLQLQQLIGDTVDILVAVRDRTADGTRRLSVPVPQPAPSAAAAVAELVPPPSVNGQPGPAEAAEGGC